MNEVGGFLRRPGATVWAEHYASLAAALAAAAGGTLIGGLATYTLTSPLAPAAGTRLDLRGSTLKHAADTAAFSLLDLDGVAGVEILGGTFDGNVANQAVWSEQRHAIRIRDASRIVVRGATFTGLIGDGIYVSHAAGASAPYTGSSDVEITGCAFVGTNLNRNGVSLVCGQRLRVHHNSFYRMATAAMPGAVDLEPNDSDDFLRDVIVDHNVIDNGAGAVVAVTGIQLANSTANATMDGILIAHNTIRGDLLRGIRLRGSSSVTERGVVVRGNVIRDVTPAAGTNYGIRTDDIQADVSGNTVDGVTGVGIYQLTSVLHMVGNTIRSCTVSGFEQGDATDTGHYAHNKVRDCGAGFSLRSSNCDFVANDIAATSGMTYGIIFNAGSSNRLTLNRVSGASTANYSAVGSQIKRDNVGYVTEASGTGAIASGATSATVTHGLAETPPSSKIRVTLLENPTNDPGIVWVDTIGATTFKVNCRSDPGASNLDFAWYAEAD